MSRPSRPQKAPAKAAALPAAAAKFMGSPSLQLHVRHGGAALHASAAGVEEMLLLLASGRLRIIYKNLWPFQIRLFICFFTDIRSFVLNKDPV